jgi:hypothetical protein
VTRGRGRRRRGARPPAASQRVPARARGPSRAARRPGAPRRSGGARLAAPRRAAPRAAPPALPRRTCQREVRQHVRDRQLEARLLRAPRHRDFAGGALRPSGAEPAAPGHPKIAAPLPGHDCPDARGRGRVQRRLGGCVPFYVRLVCGCAFRIIRLQSNCGAIWAPARCQVARRHPPPAARRLARADWLARRPRPPPPPPRADVRPSRLRGSGRLPRKARRGRPAGDGRALRGRQGGGSKAGPPRERLPWSPLPPPPLPWSPLPPPLLPPKLASCARLQRWCCSAWERLTGCATGCARPRASRMPPPSATDRRKGAPPPGRLVPAREQVGWTGSRFSAAGGGASRGRPARPPSPGIGWPWVEVLLGQPSRAIWPGGAAGRPVSHVVSGGAGLGPRGPAWARAARRARRPPPRPARSALHAGGVPSRGAAAGDWAPGSGIARPSGAPGGPDAAAAYDSDAPPRAGAAGAPFTGRSAPTARGVSMVAAEAGAARGAHGRGRQASGGPATSLPGSPPSSPHHPPDPPAPPPVCESPLLVNRVILSRAPQPHSPHSFPGVR